MTGFSAVVVFSIAAVLEAGFPGINFSERPDTTPDGRFGTRCYPSGIESRGEVCQVSFARLIAGPEAYHGRRIALVGYLIDRGGQRALYPSSESLRSGLTIEGVELANVPPAEEYKREDYMKGRGRTGVTGVFDAYFVGLALERLGLLHDVSRIYDASLPLGDLND